LCTFLIFTMRALCPSHVQLLHFMTLITFVEAYKP
jgi:hypothetical protein